MQYKCISKLKRRGLFRTIFEGDFISVKKYEKLSDEEKSHFEVNYEDESFQDQWERNRLEDDKLDNED